MSNYTLNDTEITELVAALKQAKTLLYDIYSQVGCVHENGEFVCETCLSDVVIRCENALDAVDPVETEFDYLE